jgi:hypothetical protein
MTGCESNDAGEDIMRRVILIIIGSISLVLGILGVFLPLLPTTPFLLLAAACFAKSTKKFYDWLINHKYLGEYIRNYQEGKGLTLTTKVSTLLLLWLSVGYSTWRVDRLWVQAILLLIALGVTVHLVSLPTLKKRDPEAPAQEKSSSCCSTQADDPA